MRKFLALALLFLSSPAWAQNPTCPTRPPGDNTNACASTAFVQNAIATPPLPHTHIFVGNSLNLAHDFGSLATFSDGGTLNLSPTANSLTKGFEIGQSGPSNGVSVGGEFAFNRTVISSEAINTGSFSDVVNAWRITHNFGGPTTSGSRDALQVDLNLNAPTSAANLNRNYVTEYLNLNLNSGDGGTNTGAGALGNATVQNIVLRANAAATNFSGLVLAEWDLVTVPGSSFTSDTGLLMARWGSVAASGTVDAAIGIFSAGNIAGLGVSLGWKQGIYLLSTAGTPPISSNGCVICSDGGSWSITDVINLSTYTVTGSYFNFLNYRVDGTGYTVQANVAAPASPAAGFVTTYSDSTNLRFHDKNSAGTIGTTVVADTGAAFNFLTAISTSGVISKRRPVCADLSDAAPSCSSASAISLVVGTTVITSGTTLRVLYDNAGVLGEYTNTQLTALINPATTTLSGALPAWPNNTTTFFRGDGTYTSVNLPAHSAQATNTIVGNATSGSASPTALAIGSCSTASSALIWTTNTGFGCNTSITASSMPTTGLTGTLQAAQEPAHTGDVTNSAGSLALALAAGSASVLNSGTLASARLTGSYTGITGVGTITAGTWQGTIVTGTYGGTGVNNGSNTITTGGNVTFSGAFATTITVTATTNSTLPAGTHTLGGLDVAQTWLPGSGTNTFSSSNNYSLIVRGATSATNNYILLDTQAATQQAGIYMADNGSLKWLFAKNSDQTFSFFDIVNSIDQFKVTAGSGTTGIVSFSGQLFANGIASDTATVDSTVCIASSNGKLLKGTGTLGICLGTSGRQFKTDFEPMLAGIDEIFKMKLWNYRYLDGFGDSGARKQYGPTAQDVAEVLPDLVRFDSNGQAINYDIGAFIPIALHALQQLKGEITELRKAK